MLKNSFIVLIVTMFFLLVTGTKCTSISPDNVILAISADSIPDTTNWTTCLTPAQYRVLRQGGTERPFTGELLSNKEKGVYKCAGCGNPLFHSDTKFDSGTGWPSFYQKINEENVGERPDIFPSGIKGIEVHCAKCKGHLGHVFEDGPKPTGLRYCINSLSLIFEKDSMGEGKR